ncbi:glycosyltransferase family 8 protein [Arcticibacter pallidicorallinus]|nr:glycosyltransferase family 8 protein [Arcticibacter pallidicorallinus]
MSEPNTIILAVACNNHYVIMLAALLKSIEINHTSGELIEVWIIDDNISRRNKARLEASVDCKMIKLLWIRNKEAIPHDMKLPLDRNTYPLNIFMRIFIPYFIPANRPKVLYMDVDMIVTFDISKLWQTDVSNYVLAAVTDSSAVYIKNNIKNYKELGLPGDSKYFNSGLLLMNVSRWRDEDVTRKVIHSVNDNRKFTEFSDQYGLNVNLVGKWLELDPLWNYYADGTHLAPYNIHFFHRKPFYKSYFNNKAYQELFYKYLNQTEWRNSKPVGEIKRYIIKARNVLEKLPLYLKQRPPARKLALKR